MELSSLNYLFLLFLLSLLLYLFCYQKPSNKSNSAGTKYYSVVEDLPQFLKNRHRFLDWAAEALAESPTHTMVIQGLGQVPGLLTANPANIEHMLKTNFENYPKGERAISMLEDFLGHGIFNSDGERWNWQRKAASFEFNKRSLRNFVVDTVQHEIDKRLVPLLKKAGEKADIIDLQHVLECFAFDTICKVAFGEDPASLPEGGESQRTSSSSDFVKAFGDASHIVVARFNDLLPFTWRIKKFMNIGTESHLKKSIKIVDDFAMKIIRSRREKSLELNEDLLSRFASNKDNTEEFLRDIVISFIVAGRETTSSALTWLFWLLSSRPDVEKKILEELKAIRQRNQNSSSMFSFDELREMQYLHAAITEALRLYPPVPLDAQSCREDDVMPDGTFVGKGWSVTYSAYAVARLEDVWGEDCRDYKPERWLLEDVTFRPENPSKFPVFHVGPRMCLGKEMAYIQMKSVAASVLERFEIDVMVAKEKPPEYTLSLTIRMKEGLPVRVRDREELGCIT